MKWLVAHVGTILTRVKVGADGLAPDERLKGKSSRTPTAQVVDSVLCTRDKDALSEVPKSHPRLMEGTFLGIRNRTGEDIVGLGHSIVYAWMIRGRPDSET